MALRFRLKGLAETYVEEVTCPCCNCDGSDESFFATEHTKVTYEGIVVVLQCKNCDEIFIPNNQHLGIIDQSELRSAVTTDHQKTGEPLFSDLRDVLLDTERLNASRKGMIH